MVVRHGTACKPEACAGSDQHDDEEQRDPPGAVTASPATALHRHEHVERHGWRLATSAVVLQPPRS